jgi:hypothetical protein
VVNSHNGRLRNIYSLWHPTQRHEERLSKLFSHNAWYKKAVRPTNMSGSSFRQGQYIEISYLALFQVT